MELRYPPVLIAGLIVLAAAIVYMLTHRRKPDGTGAVHSAMGWILEDNPVFRASLRKSRILRTAALAGIAGALICGLVLAARPFEKRTVNTRLKQRDIYLCMDVSYSLCDLNEDVIDQLEEIISGLKGDRLGISIFNTSTVLYVPLCDDYDFIRMRLEDLREYFSLQKQLREYEYKIWLTDAEYAQYEKLITQLDYYDAGTLVDNTERGSSLIGEGLGSALFSFPDIDDEERTRVIIMTTDNDERALSEPLVSLDEASEMAAEHDVTVFGIFPEKETYDSERLIVYDRNLNLFRSSVEKTGGIVYQVSSSWSPSRIISDIKNQPAMEAAQITDEYEEEIPQIPVMCMWGCLAVSAACEYLRRRGGL